MHTVDEIVERMSGQGLRITDQRKTLARLFADTPGYLAPKDIYEYMGKTYSGLSFDTVYRNLRVMEELGVLEQVMFEEGVKFKLHCKDHDHHHHMICLQCGHTIPVSYCPMDQIPVPEKFKVVRHKFEVFGYCEECSFQESASEGQ
ncbi:Fur family transcriptional regulator [Paenibacillus sp. IITD108]|uniref:Fur family transcriptional regulator n=1 Tax=Paenibacillus sp. IITD108 TaxID=3116649 RepID=UPI002F3F0C20